MPGLKDLKTLLEGKIKKPCTLTLEVQFDNKDRDVFDAISQTEEFLEDLRLSAPGAKVRGSLAYDGNTYEVK